MSCNELSPSIPVFRFSLSFSLSSAHTMSSIMNPNQLSTPSIATTPLALSQVHLICLLERRIYLTPITNEATTPDR